MSTPFSPDIDSFLRQTLLRFLENPAEASLRFGAFHEQWCHYFQTRKIHTSSIAETLQPTQASVARSYHATRPHKSYIDKYPWNSCRLATTLVASLCSNGIPHRLEQVIRLNTHFLDGTSTSKTMRTIPSSPLRPAFHRAYEAARSPTNPRSTCLVVTIADVGWTELNETNSPLLLKYESFGHSFAMLVSPAGVSMFQAYDLPKGYTLDDQIKQSPKPMSFELAEALMCDLETVFTAVEWSPEVNAANKRCFGVDLLDHHAATGKSLNPVIRPWVSFVELPDVTVAGIKTMAEWMTCERVGGESRWPSGAILPRKRGARSPLMGLMPDTQACRMFSDLIEAGVPGKLAMAMALDVVSDLTTSFGELVNRSNEPE